VSKKIEDGSFEPPNWWRRLRSSGGNQGSLAEYVRGLPATLFVLALTPAYLELVVEDLLSLAALDLGRLRLVGPRRDMDVPEGLRSIRLPYDDRLDGARSPIRGTESDFPQRAACHFVQMVCGRAPQSPEEHKRLVVNALRDWPRKKVPVRQKLPEKDLRRVIKGVLHECDGHWSRALRRLRDHRKIACEQKRFRRICNEILQGTT
jgi:hypothetical protein